VDGQDSRWAELTAGEQSAVRFTAADLQQAQRLRHRILGDDSVSAILDLTVVVDDDIRAAHRRLDELSGPGSDTLSYAGTLDGLAGLIADIYVTGVADGVTLIPAEPHQDVRSLGAQALERVAARLRPAA
jgi:urease gamma subunit